MCKTLRKTALIALFVCKKKFGLDEGSNKSKT